MSANMLYIVTLTNTIAHVYKNNYYNYQLLDTLNFMIIEHNAVNDVGDVYVQHDACINMTLDASE
jgi:hypothetical protein